MDAGGTDLSHHAWSAANYLLLLLLWACFTWCTSSNIPHDE
jgi:hypothetical protein